MKKSNFFKTGLRVSILLLFIVLSIKNTIAQTYNLGNTGGQQSGNNDGFYYELWMNTNLGHEDDGNWKGWSDGSSSMTLGTGCLFNCSWTHAYNALSRRGLKYDVTKTHQQIGTFTATYNCTYSPQCDLGGNSYLGIYGWTKDDSKPIPLVEYYIIENFCNWNPSQDTSAKSFGTITVNGADYDIYRTKKYNAPNITGINQDFYQYISLRKSLRTSGVIYVSEHFNKWEQQGLPMGKMYEVSMLAEGYCNSGSASFSLLDVSMDNPVLQPESVHFGHDDHVDDDIIQLQVGVPSTIHNWVCSWDATYRDLVLTTTGPITIVSQTPVDKNDFNLVVQATSTGTATITATEPKTGISDIVTLNISPSNAKSYNTIVRALGTKGGEHINLLVDGRRVNDGWDLTTSYADYTATILGIPSDDINVEFTNDAENSDVRVDYIIVNGEKRETENMQYNSGAYANGVCGGGSYTEWIHCNGAAGYGDIEKSHTITIRARGNAGGEHIDLLINGQPVNSGWWLGTSYQEYSATVYGDGDINVEYDNDGGLKDVVIDWLKVDNQNPRQAENMQYNTGAYANGYCGGGSYTQWLHCNGVIGFGMISANFKSAPSIGNESEFTNIKIYPNPSSGEISIELGNIESSSCIKIYDFAGKVLYSNTNITENIVHVNGLKKGVYAVNIESNGNNYFEKLVVY